MHRNFLRSLCLLLVGTLMACGQAEEPTVVTEDIQSVSAPIPEKAPALASSVERESGGIARRDDSANFSDLVSRGPFLDSDGSILAGAWIMAPREHDLENVSAYFEPGFFGQGREQFVEEALWSLRTDEEGLIDLPRDTEFPWMDHEGFTGGIPLVTRGGDWVELPPFTWRKARVLDHRGRPVAGARVGHMDPLDPWRESLLGTTNQEGIAELPINAYTAELLAEDELHFHVQTLAGLGVTILGSAVGPSETLTFQLPDTPRLELDILGLDGNLYDGPLVISMSRQNVNLNLLGGTMGGKFHVPAVEPNAHVFLRIRSWDDRYSYLKELTLPDAEEGVIKLEARLGKVGFTLRGVVADEVSAPDANATFRLSLPGYPPEFLLTDSEGRFEIFMGDLYVQPDSTDITITKYTHDLPTAYWKGIAVPIGNRDLIDLGIIALKGAETLASGVVLHDAGIPHSNAQVFFERVDPTALDLVQPVYANTARNGSFHIRGVASEFEDGPFQLRVTAPNLKSAVYPVYLGQTDMELSLRRKVQVEGRFLFGDSILSSTLRVRFEESNPVAASTLPDAEMIGSEGRFKAFDVPSGSYSLVLSTADGRELHVEHGIHIEGTPSLLELPPIDLRHRVRYRYVTCVDTEGKRIREASYRVEGNAQWKSTAYGMAGIFLRNHERDIHVRAEGYVTKTVELVDDETSITLQRE